MDKLVGWFSAESDCFICIDCLSEEDGYGDQYLEVNKDNL